MWLFSSDETEVEVSAATWDVTRLVSIRPRDDSWLRLQLAAAPDEEHDPFLTAVEESERGRRILSDWQTWLETCDCDLAATSSDCRVHLVIDRADRVFELIQDEWYKVAPWYRRDIAPLFPEPPRPLR
jgi:hypothetical protein